MFAYCEEETHKLYLEYIYLKVDTFGVFFFFQVAV